jgi:hypothetical protein
MYNNNNYNSYGYGGYGGYGSYQTYQAPQQQPQTTYIPLTFVNGIDGVNKHILAPNTSVYLRDSDSNRLYIKTCDSTGRCDIKCYELVETSPNSLNKQQKDMSSEFISKKEFEELQNKIEGLEKRISELGVANNE